ncbi:hypothetical protein NZK33_18695 [Cyanobium sp. FGCU-6]|nr:hypothetical protein [Cyanobium sp. FGCU6]
MTSWTTRLADWSRPLKRALVLGLALLLSVGLAACSGSTSMKDAARTAVSVARTAADVTGNEQLKSVLDPVLSVLNTSERQVKAGNVAAAGSTLRTFQALWDTARPVVKLAAGPNYGLIDKGVTLLTTTFGGDTAPSKDNALAAITGLIKPLAALLA